MFLLNEIVNTSEAINEIIDTLDKVNGNFILHDTISDRKICLDCGAIQLLKAYYISKREHYG